MTFPSVPGSRSMLLPAVLLLAIPFHARSAAVFFTDPPTLSFTGQQYQAIAAQTLVVSNSGDSDLNYTLASDSFWLTSDTPGGSLPAGMATSHVITIGTRGREALLSHNAALTVADPAASNSPVVVPASLVLQPASPPGRVVAWGNNSYLQTNVPANLTNAVVLAGGGYHSLAIRGNRSVTAWGTNGNGQTNIPSGLTNAVAVSAGWYHSLALRPDGTMDVWGRNVEGQTNQPPGLTGITAIAGGSYHSLAVHGNGSVAAWGFNFYGQTNVPASVSNVLAVAGGNYHSLALRRDGTVTAWGSDDYGQSTMPGGLSNVVAIAAGGYHSLALKNDGTLSGWGRDNYGQATTPPGLTNVVAIGAGQFHSLAFLADGTVIAWGRNIEGQTNVPATLIGASVAVAGGYHNLAIAPARTLVVSSSQGSPNPGVGTSWPLFNSTQTCSVATNVIAGGTQYVNLGWAGTGDIPASGTSNSLTYVVANNSTLTWFWQTNYWASVYATGGGSVGSNLAWRVKDTSILATATGALNQVFLGWFGTTNGCTLNGQDITIPMTQARSIEARFTAPQLAPIPSTLTFTGEQYAAIASQPLVISNAGTGPMVFSLLSDAVWLFATPSTGSLAAGQATTCTLAVVTRGLDARDYSGTLTLSDPLATHGPLTSTVWLSLLPRTLGTTRVNAWGDNSYLQTNVPPELTNATAVAAGVAHSVALREDGSVLAWGYNNFGQTNAPALTTAVAVGAGNLHSLSLLDDGTLVAWGNNTLGQTDLPGGFYSALAIAVGGNHSLALSWDGTVLAWGENSGGQTNVPPGLSNVMAVAAGAQHSLALLNGGSVTGWGDNAYGQCTPPPGLSNVIAIAAAGYYSLALQRDGTVVGWGDGGVGQTNIPASATNGIRLSAGPEHALLLRTDESIVAWGYNGSGETNVPGGPAWKELAAGGEHSLGITPGRYLTIASSQGTPSPSAGTYFLNRDSAQTATVELVILNGGTQYLNLGWSGSGSVPVAGASNAITFTLTDDSTLDWLWQTNYQFTLATTGAGTLSATNGWYGSGTNLTITASALSNHVFVSWAGDTNDGLISGSSITLPMTQARSLQALFVAPAMVPLSSNLTFSGPAYSEIAGQTLMISNAGAGTVSYSVTPDVFWLNVSNSSDFAPSLIKLFNVSVSTRGLEPRIHRGKLTITSAEATNGPMVLDVILALTHAVRTVAAWGDNASGQTNVPVSLTNAIAIASGSDHAMALRNNGTVAAWGSNASSQTNIPSGLSNVVWIGAGWNHNLVVLADGSVRAWGSNSNGQTNVPTGLMAAASVAGGWRHSMILLTNGTVVAWGQNAYGQTNVPASLSNVVQISAGHSHSLALRGDGRVVAWGDNTYGQTNVPATLTNAVAVDGGNYFSVALRADGTVVAWGQGTSGQTNIPTDATNIVAISAGADHVLALRESRRFLAWGSNASGQTNLGPNLLRGHAISAGRLHSMVFITPGYSLVVTSSFDSPIPPTGTHWYVMGTIQTCSVISEITQGGTQFACVGWVGTGSTPTNAATNAVTFTLNTNSTLSWLWQTNFWLTVNTSGSGTSAPASSWHKAGNSVAVTGAPAAYWHFVSWSGSPPVQASESNPYTFNITTTRTVTVRFLPDLTSNGVPHEWLASYGWTNFEADVLIDWEGDGMVNGEEYIAGTDPTQALDFLAMSAASNNAGVVVAASTRTGRVYSLYYSTSILTGGWLAVQGQTNIPGTGGTILLTATNPPPFSHYYRIGAKLAP